MYESGGYVDGYLKEQEKKNRHAKVQKSMSYGIKAGLIALSLVIVVIAVISLIPKNVSPKYTQGYEVLLNGTVLGVTSNAEPITNTLNDIREEFKNDYNMNVFDDTTLEYRPVMIEKQFICPPDYFEKILKECVDVKVMAWVILVNNAPAAAVKTEAEAQSALDRVLAPFLDIPTDRQRIDVDFVEDVEVKEMPIEYSQVNDEEYAYKLLRYGGDIDEKYHTVVSGETLYNIGKTYGVKVSDLQNANPKLASTSKIYPGDQLLIAQPASRVNVKFVELVNRIEPMAYETEKIEDDSMYETERVVVQEGYEGTHDINAEITYINGREVEINIISEVIISPPINAIVRVGTKQYQKYKSWLQSDMPIRLNRRIDIINAS